MRISLQSDFIKLEQQEVPSLLETMSVEPGVTLREKGASKQGPKEEPSDSRMTRADFMTLVQSTADLAQQSSFQEAREVRGSQLIYPWFDWSLLGQKRRDRNPRGCGACRCPRRMSCPQFLRSFFVSQLNERACDVTRRWTRGARHGKEDSGTGPQTGWGTPRWWHRRRRE